MMMLIAFVLALLVVVSVHEWGHFYTARRLGVPVVRFSIGMGPAIFSRQYSGVEYRLAWLPLGGYVMFAEPDQHPMTDEQAMRAFSRRPVWVRAAIVAAGPAINIVLAWLLMTVVLMVGLSAPRAWLAAGPEHTPWSQVSGGQVWQVLAINDVVIDRFEQLPVQLLRQSAEYDQLTFQLESWQGEHKRVTVSSQSWRALAWSKPAEQMTVWGLSPTMPPIAAVVDRVAPDSPAAVAGLQAGDEVVAVNDMRVDAFADLSQWIRLHPNESVRLTLLRNQQQLNLTVQLATHVNGDKTVGYLGVTPQMPIDWQQRWFTEEGMSVSEAMQAALPKLWDVTSLTLQAIGRLLTGRSGMEQLSGPIGIAQAAGQSLEHGALRFIQFLALLSLSLGVLNLLPLPLLDGGHLVLYALELLRGKALSVTSMLWWQKIGFVLIAGMTLLAISSDIKRLIGG